MLFTKLAEKEQNQPESRKAELETFITTCQEQQLNVNQFLILCITS